VGIEGEERNPTMLHSEDRNDQTAGLVALLDLIERPALAVASDGRVLGGNQYFLELLRSANITAASELSSFLADGSTTRVLSCGEGQSAQELDLVFRDGLARSVRIEATRLADGQIIRLLVLSKGARAGAGLRATSSMRHDLAGPLTAILGTAELMLMRGQELPREVRDSLGQILENCGRMSEILAKCSVQDRD